MSPVRTALLCLALALPPGAAAQEALVLSGGGSRGLAHVGVFIALEELGYDPDLVVGTSMGAVVGALYAAGYDPDEIRARVVAVDWTAVFAPTPTVVGPLRSIRHPLLSLDLDLERLRFNRGLLGQWRINRTLARLLFDANARSRGDFDRLARRYRAVAADLRTGETVVLARGDLARAARASMSVPGAFAPVEWEGRVLVDGGIADNLPTSVARGLGAARVIASDVSRLPERIESLAPLAVIGRAIDLMQENTQRDPVPPDALVQPMVDASFSSANFPEDPTPLIEIGVESALRDLPPAPAAAPGAATASGERPLPLPPDSFGRLEIDAPDPALEALARRAFWGVAPGRYDPDAVLQAVDRLYTTGLFEAVWPMVTGDTADPAAPATLHVRLAAPPQLSLSGAAGYEQDRGGRMWAALDRYATVARRPVVLTAAAATSGIERWGSLSARVYTAGRPALAWSLGGHVLERDVRTFLEDGREIKETLRAGGWLAVEFPHLLRDRLLTAAARAEWIDDEDGREAAAYGPLLRFASIHPDILVVGIPFIIEGEHRWGPFGYSRGLLSASRELQIGPARIAALLDLRAVTADAPTDVRPALGDQHAVPGLRWGEMRGQARAVGGLDLAYPVRTAWARVQLRAGTAPETLRTWQSSRWTAGLHIGGLWQSAIGAIELGYGVATLGDGRLELSLGRQF